jgi:N-terminal domain on NACHT_NTPase and P-loop NTPases
LIDILQRTHNQADADHITAQTAKALKPVVDGCLSQVKLLEDILVKATPTEKDSTWRRRFKALSSFSHDKTVQQITSTLERYVQTLTYHQATSSSDLSRKLEIQEPSQQSKLNSKVSPRKAVFMLPFNRGDVFVGRGEILNEVELRLNTGPRRAALAGIGGAG